MISRLSSYTLTLYLWKNTQLYSLYCISTSWIILKKTKSNLQVIAWVNRLYKSTVNSFTCFPQKVGGEILIHLNVSKDIFWKFMVYIDPSSSAVFGLTWPNCAKARCNNHPWPGGRCSKLIGFKHGSKNTPPVWLVKGTLSQFLTLVFNKYMQLNHTIIYLKNAILRN